MQFLDGRLLHSASDLNAFTECVHLAALGRAVARGTALRPDRTDPTAELLARKGEAHEARYLARLRERFGSALVAFEERPAATREAYAAAERQTVAAMERGAAIIYQGTFFDGTFVGRADFLRRVPRASARWAWSYEVIDTKLALSAKPYFLVQLCHYSEHVARLQGTAPHVASIVLGSGDERRFAVAEYAGYYRNLKAAYLRAAEQGADEYPFECAHCERCAWREPCAAQRDRDDHLSLVAGIRRDQVRKLETGGVRTLTALATAPTTACPPRLRPETFANLRAQAGEQHRYRRARATGSATHSYRFREAADGTTGFARLPRPSAGDVFFDIEGDPMFRPDRGLEYLWGVYLRAEDEYRPFWGVDPTGERRAFEAFVDFVVERLRRFPDAHVYHYAPYETTALKRLMGQLASREDDVDRFLRQATFVDLYPVVRQSIWISQSSYSIKRVEALYGYERSATTRTRAGDDSIVMFESWLETRDDATLADIQAYNEDDCRSTFALREWLVGLREERNAQLPEPIAWRAAPADRPPPDDVERTSLEAALLADLPVPDSIADLRGRSDDVRARWLLGNLIHYHRREHKPQWWEYFARIDHPETLVDDHAALGDLTYCPDVAPERVGRSFVHTYTFPEQEHRFECGDVCHDATGRSAGSIHALDDGAQRVRIKLAGRIAEPASLRAILPGGPIPDTNKRIAVEQIARAYHAGDLERAHPATLALLVGRLPRLRDRPRGAPIQPPVVDAAALTAVTRALDGSYVVVQGPPGSGKSTLGAALIVDALAAGVRVALAANSHKALHHVLAKVEATAAERGVVFRGCHKSNDRQRDSVYRSRFPSPAIVDATRPADYAGCDLVSGTTFAWSEPTQVGAFDLVVVDEAGQISLADALVVSRVARNVVLLGDPQQLAGVVSGSHPIGTDVSILEHLLGERATVAVERGIFLDRSYRMHPRIDAFVSRTFYDGRLEADAPNAANRIAVADEDAAGLRWVAVDHEGNGRRSVAEAEYVVDEVDRLLRGGQVAIRAGAPRPIEPRDIVIVTPYNLQRTLIAQRLERRGIVGVAVGTVDKFQGQEAPVVLYSMATSDASLAPRGIEFLLDPHRFNVAVSRAQAVSILVCSPHLVGSRAATIEQMRRLNILCTFVEEARASADADTSVRLPFGGDTLAATSATALRSAGR